MSISAPNLLQLLLFSSPPGEEVEQDRRSEQYWATRTSFSTPSPSCRPKNGMHGAGSSPCKEEHLPYHLRCQEVLDQSWVRSDLAKFASFPVQSLNHPAPGKKKEDQQRTHACQCSPHMLWSSFLLCRQINSWTTIVRQCQSNPPRKSNFCIQRALWMKASSC